MFADTNIESLEPIEPDIIGASSAVSSSQMEATSEKVPYFIIYLIINWFDPFNKIFLYIGT